MDLSIVIVNWNCVADVEVCLESLRQARDGLRSEIIVVDNASTDDSTERLRKYPDIQLVELPQNVGFAQANNVGFRSALGETLLLLNPDTKVLGNALEVMHKALQSSPKYGAVGCKLLNADGTLQTTCIQPFPTILNQMLCTEWLRMKTRRLRLWGIRPLFDHTTAFPLVQVISGACLMVRRRAFQDVGGFSSDYFMYGEDVDLCYSLQQKGWEKVFVRDASVIHYGGQSSKKQEKGFSIVVMRESVFRFLRKSRGNSYALMFRASLGISSIARILLAAPLWFADRAKGSNTIHKWFRILRWSLGLEAWAKDLKAPELAEHP